MMNFRNLIRCCSLLMFVTFSSYAQNNDYYLLVGTYTSKGSEGLYVYKFNTRTGDFASVSVTGGIKNPTFLDVAPNEKFVYAVGETEDGSVNAYSFDNKTGKLTKLNTQSAGGSGPCHISVDKTGKWALVGNYGGGSLSILPIEKDGSLGAPTQTIKHEGKGVNASRQEKPHVHSVNIAPNNTDIFVADLGIDKIVSYQLDAQTGRLSAGNPPATKTADGAGPRHFKIHPNGNWAYVIQELNSTVTAYHYGKGALEEMQTISTLPPEFKGRNACADIHISADGKFLYGSNRFYDHLVIYSIDQKTGKLTYITNQPVQGKTPRNFMIDPTGKWVLVANQDSDNIVLFKRDAKTGTLTPTGKEVKVSMPVCLKMIKAAK
ncbi:lactonase family protein [Emticicia sp. 21SJ11W-3]|uniref:lactonase family protein n=1 Tax=Emticicia sp. 21SJ11W-3 TaxID=2916755 RepID=UPI00209EDBD8|nr:lactonase family protein [Emticicia sp. 21SJ11W-3]UTA68277.1 lactonase family protein [Emticicia sp. 21SJ11W-3]